MNELVLFDRIINLEVRYRYPTKDGSDEYTEDTFAIDCSGAGPKPNISFSWKRVPTTFCYDCTIEVTNLYLPINAIYAEEITIEAGYRGVTERFKCTVFASYQATPGPDGVTTFRCLVASADISLFNDQPYDLSIYHSKQTKFTVYQVLMEVQAAMQKYDSNMQIVVEPKPVFTPNSTTLNKDKQTNPCLCEVYAPNNVPLISFNSGYELINALQTQLNAQFKPYGIEITTLMFNNTILFAFLSEDGYINLSIDKENTRTEIYDEAIPVLDLVSSASWNAGTLTVTAPWNPKIAPGTLFKFATKYYTGGDSLPISVSQTGGHTDPLDCYYTITQEVKFSTVDDNEMIIMAVPMRNSPKANQWKKEIPLDIPDDLLEKYCSMARTPISIRLGAKDSIVEKAEAIDDLSFTLPAANTRFYTIVSNDTLIGIGNKAEFQLPDLVGYYAGDVSKTVVKAGDAWFPIIMVLTNTLYKQDPKGRYKSLKLDMDNPDRIIPDRQLVVPVNLTWRQIQLQYKSKVLHLFDVCYEHYIKIDKKSFAQHILDAKNLLDKGIIDE